MNAMSNYRSQFGDTTYTKVFVGGLAWETPAEEMRRYFEQFGEILEAVIILDKNTGKSKGYGFVTFRDPESARRACVEPNPMIDGRRANCNIASFGRPRPSPPRGGNQGVPQQVAPSSYSGVAGAAPPPPPLPPVIYPLYGYPTYSPDYGYHQAIYNRQGQQPQYYPHHHVPYYFGYNPLQTAGGIYSPSPTQPQRPSYLYYPTQMEAGSFSTNPPSPLQFPHRPFHSLSDSQNSQPRASSEKEVGPSSISEQSPKV